MQYVEIQVAAYQQVGVFFAQKTSHDHAVSQNHNCTSRARNSFQLKRYWTVRRLFVMLRERPAMWTRELAAVGIYDGFAVR